VVGNEKQKGFNDKSMKFQKGHKFAKGGKRPGAGRPSKAQLAERESLRQAIEREREERAGVLAARYVEMAQEDPATMRHLVDKVLPDEQKESPQSIQITFLPFAVANNTRSQIPPKDVSVTVPRNDCEVGLSPDRANGLLPMPAVEEKTIEHPQVKFHDFSSGNGKRRQ
jgi:hypothetical protein